TPENLGGYQAMTGLEKLRLWKRFLPGAQLKWKLNFHRSTIRHWRGLKQDLRLFGAILKTRVGQSGLPLIFSAPIFVRGVAVFIGLEEQNLTDAFIDVNAQREIGEITKLDH